ncbi:GNAT family N-acetyltransferase [Chryseobacterium sp. MP_3.2]|uniref:GNAT family N-acetyltransferase n=1 Tax=Chryseobacterium sp. MP_3.2 TaxID=3071712 RepID=UPI002E0A189A|nr:putative GNAT family acetyltransferase [Chryseobacterium sp. MP_3.2]
MQYNKNKEGILEIMQTEVDPEFGGKGLGIELVKAAVEDAQKNNSPELKHLIAEGIFQHFGHQVIMKNYDI